MYKMRCPTCRKYVTYSKLEHNVYVCKECNVVYPKDELADYQ